MIKYSFSIVKELIYTEQNKEGQLLRKLQFVYILLVIQTKVVI